jgi:esterase/lipase superfamily enzyme
MERSPHWAVPLSFLALACAVTVGCGQAPDNQQAQNESSGRHLVVRPLDQGSMMGGAPSVAVESAPAIEPPAARPSIAQPPMAATEPPPPESEASDLWPADNPITPIPAAPVAATEGNPLRSESAPLTLAQPDLKIADNPLRPLAGAHAFSAAPRMAMRSAPKMALPPAAADPALEPEATSEPLTTQPPRVGAAPPTAEEPLLPGAGEEPATAAPEAAGPTDSAASAPASVQPFIGSPPAPVDPAEYDVVQVFYGTDRAAIDPAPENIPEQVSRFLPTAISVLITLALGLVAMARRRVGLWLLVIVGVGVSLGLGLQASSGTLAAVRRSDHQGPQYTADRSANGRVELGLCEVTIPKIHTVGELEAPSILRLEIKPVASEHVILRKTERLQDESFYTMLKQRVAASPRKELFIFVHGFNVTFEDAARRTAQIHHDLRYEGAPIFFSWPADNKFVLTYKADEANVSWSAAHLKQFLLDVTEHSEAESINLIAHSMGNRALTSVLKELQMEFRDQSRLFNQVILAAPDIDADEFRQSIAPAMTKTANRITLYVSARDEALAASQLVHRGARAGDAGRGLVVIPGIDTIDVTPIDTSPWGHTYYGSSDPVLRDLGLLMSQSAEPSRRLWLAPAEIDGLPYWVFQPASATARVPGQSGF